MTITTQDVHRKAAELTAEGAPFALREFSVDGDRFRGFANAPANLVQLLQAGRAHGEATFLVYAGRRLSYREFFAQADALACELGSRYGIGRGDRIAIAMRNSPEWMIAFVAGALCGAILVPLNSWGKSQELLHGLHDSGARVLVCDSARHALLDGAAPCDLILASGPAEVALAGVTTLASLVEQGAASVFEAAAVDPQDIAMILYTSGSTGFPKGTAHRHVGAAQALMNMFYLGFLTVSVEGPRELRAGAEREAALLTVPLFHATGLVAGLLMPLQLGHKVVMMPRWDAVEALRLIQDEKVTGLTSVPTIVQSLLAHPRFGEFDTRSLFRVSLAGAATPTGLPELIETRIQGPSRSTGWGMTETLSVGATMSGAIYDLDPGSAGLCSPLVEMRFVDSAGQVLPEGETGELQVRGITVCAGYWNHPQASAAIRDGEWMRTGDLARIDEAGFLHIVGRIKEIVIRGGENIYPGEIEQVAYELEEVREVVVFGVPDTHMGEELAMVAYVPAGTALTPERLRGYLEDRLAHYKVPRHIELVAEPLPQNASGKLFKRQLRDEFIAAMSR
ncbi:MAG: acyl--CoA ligase [Gammaproteobacteria bacterium]|nr:acyl--CoA ligase [Gammaproteobacteria bacterium]